MKAISFVCLVLILFVCQAAAQTTDDLNWTRLESNSKNFSVAVPSNFQVIYDDDYVKDLPSSFKAQVKLSNIRYITAYQDKASILVESYRTDNLEAGLISFYHPKATRGTTEFSVGDFDGQMFVRTDQNEYVFEITVGDGDRIYRILGCSKDKDNQTLGYVLASLKFNGKNLFTIQSALNGKISETPVQMFGLNETLFSTEKTKQENSPQTKQSEKSEKTESSEDRNIENLSILYKPQARYTDLDRMNGVQGVVRLKITFSENGVIEKIVVLNALSRSLTKNAVTAARKIRFIPRRVDGKPVTITKTVSYSFSIY
jgi:TonB family protein